METNIQRMWGGVTMTTGSGHCHPSSVTLVTIVTVVMTSLARAGLGAPVNPAEDDGMGVAGGFAYPGFSYDRQVAPVMEESATTRDTDTTTRVTTAYITTAKITTTSEPQATSATSNDTTGNATDLTSFSILRSKTPPPPRSQGKGGARSRKDTNFLFRGWTTKKVVILVFIMGLVLGMFIALFVMVLLRKNGLHNYDGGTEDEMSGRKRTEVL